MVNHETDVVIVGAGVAGGLLADRLRAAGRAVLLLEAGPRVERATAWRAFVASGGQASATWPEAPHAPRPRQDDPHHYYVQEGPDLFRGGYLRVVGGTTWHWVGTAMRHLPQDLRLRSSYGQGQDWPVTYGELEPWYCQAESELGVAGDSQLDDGSPRSRDYPLPALALSRIDQAFRQSFGTRVMATPQARNSRPWQDRPACCGSASCSPVCPIGAKYDAASVHVARAEKAGARLLENAVVARIDVNGEGSVSGLLLKRADSTLEYATARLYVLAAHGVETPKLLLASRTDRLPGGVANSSDQVGRNLMDHPTMLSWGLAPEPVYPFRGPLSTAGIEEYRDGAWRSRRSAFRVEIANDGWPLADPADEVARLVAQGLRGAPLREQLARQVNRQVSLCSLCEQLPQPHNRVEAAFDQLDALGIPRPRIHYQVDPYTLRGLAEAREVQAHLLQALGASQVAHADTFGGAAHIMGTCRMGTDPRSSVTDPQGRSHDHPNLYVAGSALFPTSGTANPTLTLAALTLRLADHLLRL